MSAAGLGGEGSGTVHSWGGVTVGGMLSSVLFSSTPGLPLLLASSTRPPPHRVLTGEAVSRKANPLPVVNEPRSGPQGWPNSPELGVQRPAGLSLQRGASGSSCGKLARGMDGPKGSSGGRDPAPSPQPSFPRSVEPDQQESLGSAESHFASGVPCLLIKGKKETKKKRALKPGMEISSEQSHQADSSGELTETITTRLLPCAETSDAPFNYESQQEAWKTCALEPGAGGGQGWGWVPGALA